jgi:hypothetical protein
LRFRPDKAPRQCSIDQILAGPRADLGSPPRHGSDCNRPEKFVQEKPSRRSDGAR